MNTITMVSLCIFALLTTTTMAGAQSEVDKLRKLLDERYAWQLQQYPEMAMARGDYSHADHLTDSSLGAINKRFEATKAFLDRLHEIRKETLPSDEVVNYELFDLELTNAAEGQRFRTFLAPITERDGPQQD